MGDTQWFEANADNPGTTAAGIIHQVNQDFISKGVKFVVQVGDLQDTGVYTNLDARANAAKDLYDAGIGFFPLRGNHESEDETGNVANGVLCSQQFVNDFPQTKGAAMAGTSGTLTPDALNLRNFKSPDPTKAESTHDYRGLSYSFDYLVDPTSTANPSAARFVLLDQFTPLDAGTTANLGNLKEQQAWINSQVSGKPKFVLNGQLVSGHAFVFGHKGLITENHGDSLFGNDPSQDPNAQDAFINTLYNNGVRYYIGGHDHMHNRAQVTNTKKANAITDIITQSCSYKFYTPKQKPIDKKYNAPAFGYTRETMISQDLFRVGYYIYTVDGPNVTVDYYASDPVGAPDAATPSANVNINAVPLLHFTKRETFGYSLVGKEFNIAQGKDYTGVSDSYNSNPTSPSSFTTTAKILAMNPSGGGIYNAVYNPSDQSTWFGDYSGYADPSTKPPTPAGSPRALTRAVDTGWTNKTAGLACDILKLWGMSDIGKDTTDTYVLSMTYDPKTNLDAQQVANGWFCLVSKSGNNWVNAVDLNKGGVKKFVQGAYSPSYGLGSYGVDTSKNTVWAVINYTNDFSAALSQ